MIQLPSPSPIRFQNAVTVLEIMLTHSLPSDTVLSNHFRVRHEIGQKDRAFITELVYLVLRHKRSLEACCAGQVDAKKLALLALHLFASFPLHELKDLIAGNDYGWLVRAQDIYRQSMPPEIRSELPDWLYQRFTAQWGEAETATLAATLCEPATLDLRINPMKAARQPILNELQQQGLPAEACPYSPFAIRLREKTSLHNHPRFLDGSLEIQDEGSQLIPLLLAPKRGDSIADYCAGAGGKTLLISEIMRNTGRVYAFDVSQKRLAHLKPRIIRAGLTNINPIVITDENDIKVRRLAAKFDGVLVDAPCSGSGTLRRRPDLKWRYNEETLTELRTVQKNILNAAAGLIKPGGRLVYATCSLLKAENDNIIDAFLSHHPQFKILSAQKELEQQKIDLEVGERMQLLPHRHNTDGFYACVMEHCR